VPPWHEAAYWLTAAGTALLLLPLLPKIFCLRRLLLLRQQFGEPVDNFDCW
jgi:hypothetical protein